MNERKLARPRCGMVSLSVALLLAAAPGVIRAQAIADLTVTTPRQFGYVIGDHIRHEMHLTLRAPTRLDFGSLPETGRLDRWLEIAAAEVVEEQRDGGLLFRISVDYQIVNAPRELTTLTIPQLEFLVVGGANPLPVFLPEWTFSMGPLAGSGPRPELLLRDDRQPQPIALAGRLARLSVAALLVAGLLGYGAWRRWLLPRLRRGRFPFASAYGKLRRLLRQAPTAEDYRLGLRAFHAAVNTAAGKVVFIENLPEFVAHTPAYATLQPDLAALYAHSREVFFNNAPIEEPADSLRQLADLCRRCRALERTLA